MPKLVNVLTRGAFLLEMCISMSLEAQSHPVAKNEFICSMFFIFVFPKSKYSTKMKSIDDITHLENGLWD